MDDLGRLLNIALAVVSIGALGGVGFVRGKIGELRASLEDARKEIADKDRRLTEVTATAQQLRTDLDALGRVVTGEAHWTAVGEQIHDLGEKLDSHNTAVGAHWGDEIGLLEEIRDRLPAPGSERL